MLMQFSVKNFLSFKDEMTLDLVAENQVSELKTNQIISGRHKLLNGCVLYGANGSGKSNLFKALIFMKHFIHASSKETQQGDSIRVEPFRLSTTTRNKPSMFELTFLLDGAKYRYGFEVDQRRVHSEWLFKAEKIKENMLFLRDGDKIEMSKHFREGQGLEERTRENALFLSVVAQFNGEVAGEIVRWVNGQLNVISGLQDKHFEGFTAELMEDSGMKKNVMSFLNQADLGIEDIQRTQINLDDVEPQLPTKIRNLVKGGMAYSLRTFRWCYDEKNNPHDMAEFDFEQAESEGTKKYFRLSGPILDTLRQGRALFIDELDARMHPILSMNLIRLFSTPEINTKGAQLVFATHDSNILASGLLRRDQVCMTEKNQFGVSDLYRLSDFKIRIRKDANYERNYLKGRYGAIPFLGNLELLAETSTEMKATDGI